MKSEGSYTCKLKELYTAFLRSKKFAGYRMRIKFDKDPFAVEQNNYTIKILDVYIVNDLDTWPKNPINNFKFEKFFSLLIWSN